MKTISTTMKLFCCSPFWLPGGGGGGGGGVSSCWYIFLLSQVSSFLLQEFSITQPSIAKEIVKWEGLDQ